MREVYKIHILNDGSGFLADVFESIDEVAELLSDIPLQDGDMVMIETKCVNDQEYEDLLRRAEHRNFP